MSRASLKTTSSPRSLASSLLLYGPFLFSFQHISVELQERLLYSFNFLAGGLGGYHEEAEFRCILEIIMTASPSSPCSTFKHSLKPRISHYPNHAGVKFPQMSLHKSIEGPKCHFPSNPGKKRTVGSKGQSVFWATANGTPHPTRGNDG
ncbi:hypothetical protein CDAR_619501 [Caerostris darwini]|uniref:Uncharacterized protein n=1 Tax=Caerostris darwini TaxID=1538125 RepID=A0AAV4TVL3_9ARAC|nr:hypothetical protein CDAR_619501 [Caerostris darwini]